MADYSPYIRGGRIKCQHASSEWDIPQETDRK